MNPERCPFKAAVRVVMAAVIVAFIAMPLSLAGAAGEDEGALAGEGMNFYFGSLHGHSSYSDGTGTPVEVFAWARDTIGFDFYALTDHGERLTQAEWEDSGQQADLADQDGSFTALRGFEWTSGTYGHLCAFGHGGLHFLRQASRNSVPSTSGWTSGTPGPSSTTPASTVISTALLIRKTLLTMSSAWRRRTATSATLPRPSSPIT